MKLFLRQTTDSTQFSTVSDGDCIYGDFCLLRDEERCHYISAEEEEREVLEKGEANFSPEIKICLIFQPYLGIQQPRANSRDILKRQKCVRSTVQSPFHPHRPWLCRNLYPQQHAYSLNSSQTTKFVLSRRGEIQLDRNLVQIHFILSLIGFRMTLPGICN